MIEFQDMSSGVAVFVDPLAITAVLPAIAPAPEGIAVHQVIPRVIAAQVVVIAIGPLVVRGMPRDIVDQVEKAKAATPATLIPTRN